MKKEEIIKKILLTWNNDLKEEEKGFVDIFNNGEIEIEYEIPKKILLDIFNKGYKQSQKELQSLRSKRFSSKGLDVILWDDIRQLINKLKEEVKEKC